MAKAEYLALHQDAKILEADSYGEKVLLKDQKIIKLFRTKRLLTSSLIYPYSWRFARNAQKLHELGIPTIQVERQFYCAAIRRYGVIYPLLSGTSLAELFKQSINNHLFIQLAHFIAHLHDLGIYFRSLHAGNILLLDNGSMGLIDIADMRFKKNLSVSECQRNFIHFFRYSEYHPYFNEFGWQAFFNEYNQQREKTMDIYCFLVKKGVIKV